MNKTTARIIETVSTMKKTPEALSAVCKALQDTREALIEAERQLLDGHWRAAGMTLWKLGHIQLRDLEEYRDPT